MQIIKLKFRHTADHSFLVTLSCNTQPWEAALLPTLCLKPVPEYATWHKLTDNSPISQTTSPNHAPKQSA